MVSNASELFPEPDSPVNTMSRSRGRSREMLRRLCSRAPRTTSMSDTPTSVSANACSMGALVPACWPPSGTTLLMPVRPHVVVVGSGFGGLNAALRLARLPVEVTVIDRDNYHGFWPLLYQVATAGLGSDDIAQPIRAIYAGHGNIAVRVGTVSAIRLTDRVVEIDGEPIVPYDYLILAAGSSTSDFGIPGVEEH